MCTIVPWISTLTGHKIESIDIRDPVQISVMLMLVIFFGNIVCSDPSYVFLRLTMTTIKTDRPGVWSGLLGHPPDHDPPTTTHIIIEPFLCIPLRKLQSAIVFLKKLIASFVSSANFIRALHPFHQVLVLTVANGCSK